MRKSIRIFSLMLCVIALLQFTYVSAAAADQPFELVRSQEIESLGGTVYYYRHIKTGAEVIYLDNGSERREFSVGFKTPPIDSKGANHVLEHGLLCGSEKYPTKNIMHYIRGGALAEMINAVTSDDCTYYAVKTPNETEYYNLMDVYMNCIFHPLLLTDENIFRQQGIRLEYADGKARYNGIVYNELRIKSFDTLENSVNFLADQLYTSIYGNTPPSFSSGGSLNEIKQLTYGDLLRVYNTYYIPSNSMTYLAGKQDINKTLNVLDSFFKDFDKESMDMSFEDTKQIPTEPITEYHVTADTKTVDVGFMSSGVPMSAGIREEYARGIIFNIILEKMNERNPKNYVSGGNSGGISNVALLCTEIPIGRKDEIISDYNHILKELDETGFDAEMLDTKIAEYIEEKDMYLQGTDSDVFNGILYHGDPFAYMDRAAAGEYLIAHKEYFQTILKKYFTQNPYSKIIVSGHGAVPSDDVPALSPEELAQLKQATEEFNCWADAPDDPAVVASIPMLTLDEVKDAPETTVPQYENMDGIDFYLTEKEGDYASVFLPLNITAEDLDIVSLMFFYLNDRLKNIGVEGVYLVLQPMEHITGTINPQFMIAISGADKAQMLEKVTELLKDGELWNNDALSDYIKTAPEEILKNGYRDPYDLSYELEQSALGRGARLFAQSTGSVQQGSPRYYRFLKGLDADDAPGLIEKMKALTNKILGGVPSVEYVGNSGYEEFKTAVCSTFGNHSGGAKEKLDLPLGYDSAVTITPMTDANHFMIAGFYDTAECSGKLAVLGKVLSQNYVLPSLRGKHGAYGAGISFYDKYMTAVATGLSDVDLFIEVMGGMGDYLRNLNMTQRELNAVIIPAVKEFDQYYYTDSEYGVQTALYGKTAEDLARTRAEMLSVTVEDLRGYANFVDELVAQNRVFAVLGKEAADCVKFPFAYWADAETLEITPRFKKNPRGYIGGKTDAEFAPDAPITRAETAMMLARLLADERNAENKSEFTDVADDAWYAEAVNSLCEKNILSGYENCTFMPDRFITRAELAAVLSQFIFRGRGSLDENYRDLPEEAWYYEPMAKMINAGFIQGYEDGTLRPDETVTRAEAVAVINRMTGIKADGKTCPFDDVSPTHWAYYDLAAAA